MEEQVLLTEAIVVQIVVQERDYAVCPLSNVVAFIYEVIHLCKKGIVTKCQSWDKGMTCLAGYCLTTHTKQTAFPRC